MDLGINFTSFWNCSGMMEPCSSRRTNLSWCFDNSCGEHSLTRLLNLCFHLYSHSNPFWEVYNSSCFYPDAASEVRYRKSCLHPHPALEGYQVLISSKSCLRSLQTAASEVYKSLIPRCLQASAFTVLDTFHKVYKLLVPPDPAPAVYKMLLLSASCLWYLQGPASI